MQIIGGTYVFADDNVWKGFEITPLSVLNNECHIDGDISIPIESLLDTSDPIEVALQRRKILPCPACGGKRSQSYNWDGDYWRICKTCGITTRPCNSTKQANDAWNDRRPSGKRRGKRKT